MNGRKPINNPNKNVSQLQPFSSMHDANQRASGPKQIATTRMQVECPSESAGVALAQNPSAG